MLLADAAEPGSGRVGGIGGARRDRAARLPREGGRAEPQHPGELRRLLARRPPQRPAAPGSLPPGPAAPAPPFRIAARRSLIPAAAAAPSRGGGGSPPGRPPAPGSWRQPALLRRTHAGLGAGGTRGGGPVRPAPESAAPAEGAGRDRARRRRQRGGALEGLPRERGTLRRAGGEVCAENGPARTPPPPRAEGRCLHGVATDREVGWAR